MKPLFTCDHGELISEIWNTMDDQSKTALLKTVAGVMEQGGDFPEVVRAAWALGFHHAMIAVESGALIKIGQPKNN